MVSRIKEAGVFALVLVFVSILIFISQPEVCSDQECFQRNMVNCNAAEFVNEEKEASWGYSILGVRNGLCDVEVTLLVAKEGELGIDTFEGDSMVCSYGRGVFALPEKDLDKCSGKLKEDLQGTIIEKLHTYVLDNLGEIGEELQGI